MCLQKCNKANRCPQHDFYHAVEQKIEMRKLCSELTKKNDIFNKIILDLEMSIGSTGTNNSNQKRKKEYQPKEMNIKIIKKQPKQIFRSDISNKKEYGKSHVKIPVIFLGDIYQKIKSGKI